MLNVIDPNAADWDKMDGLLPVIVQDTDTAQVLMLGYMNREALEHTLDSGWVCFFSRGKQRLWTKGETSGNRLALSSAALDCDRDAILIRARPQGPTCHLGSNTCWGENMPEGIGFLAALERIIQQRATASAETSYTAQLLAKGVPRVAQKVGEEGVETALAAACGETQEVVGEAADLLYHLLVLLHSRELDLTTVCEHLFQRHQTNR